jgi:hypothetical protein
MSDSLLSFSHALHAAAGCGRVLEVVVVGQHFGGCACEMNDYITGAIIAHTPEVLIINLLGFQYEFGDDVGGVLVSACSALHRMGGPGVCRVVAQGATAASLGTLLDLGKILPLFGGRLYGDVESALSSCTQGGQPPVSPFSRDSV